MKRHWTMLPILALLITALCVAGISPAANGEENSFDHAKAGKAALQKATDYLKSKMVEGKYWGDIPGTQPGYTSLVIEALLRADLGITADDDLIRKPVEYLLSLQKDDGGIYDQGYINYNTSVAIVALTQAREHTKDADFKKRLDTAVDKAVKCIKGLQFGEETGPSAGGIGYGSKNDRSDMSNTQYALDALRAAGVKEDDPVFQEALKFVSRCQNNSETNPEEWAKDSNNDGGFIYTAGAKGIDPESKGGMETLPNGNKRYSSYGSMTYAGIKALIYCGAKKDDPRLVSAFAWVSNNFALEVNPGMPAEHSQQGLYYYYHSFAKALQVAGVETVKDKAGKDRVWRDELVQHLAKLQKDDGSWINEKEERWMEGNPILATVYAMLAIEYTIEK